MIIKIIHKKKQKKNNRILICSLLSNKEIQIRNIIHSILIKRMIIRYLNIIQLYLIKFFYLKLNNYISVMMRHPPDGLKKIKRSELKTTNSNNTLKKSMKRYLSNMQILNLVGN